jgi:iron donor protein CyaY
MSDHDFKVECDRTMEDLHKVLGEASNDYDFDPDMEQGALTITFEKPPARFVVSPQAPVQQLWVSANSRSFKFSWNGSAFALADTGETIKEMLSKAISGRLGKTVKLA